jgi:hypothetical protein
MQVNMKLDCSHTRAYNNNVIVIKKETPRVRMTEVFNKGDNQLKVVELEYKQQSLVINIDAFA